MKLLAHVLLAAALLLSAAGIVFAGEEAEKVPDKPPKPTADELKDIRALLDVIRGSNMDQWRYFYEHARPSDAGEDLYRMGPVAVPYVLNAIQSDQYLSGNRVYLIFLLGRMGAEKVFNVTPSLCKMLETWVAAGRTARDSYVEERGERGYTSYARSTFPRAAAKALAMTADPAAVPVLLKVMNGLRQAGDKNCTDARYLPASRFAIEVMRDVAVALAATDDDDARKYLEKCAVSPSSSLRVCANIAKATAMLAEDRKAAEEYLRSCCPGERYAKIIDEYNRFIMDKCRMPEERMPVVRD